MYPTPQARGTGAHSLYKNKSSQFSLALSLKSGSKDSDILRPIVD